MVAEIEQSPQPERRRRNRRPKACRPCRARKVRCNYRQPCGTCIQRHHTQLCRYEGASFTGHNSQRIAAELPPSRSISKDFSLWHSPPISEPSRQSDISGLASSPDLERLLTILDQIKASAKASCETDSVTGQVTFTGPRSHANIFRTLLPYLPEQMLPLPASIESIFGMTNRAISQPFVSLWNNTAQVTVGDILRSLPSADTCSRYYRSYQQTAYSFYPILQETGAFERNLCHTLEQLGAEDDISSLFSDQLAAHLPRTELAGYALLFAVIASGCQCCLLVENDNKLALSTRVFVACSFECLRLANMYVNPSSETIQASLILASVICNDGNPGVAAGLLGMIIQQAQSLGMHIRCECNCRSTICFCVQSMHPLWRIIVVLDSKISITYDRTPASRIPDTENFLQPLICAPHLEFWDCIFNLHCLEIKWQSLGGHDTHTSIHASVIESYLEHTAQLRQLACSAKSSLGCPDSLQATVEQLVFTMQLDFLEGMLHFQAAGATQHSNEKRLRHFHDMISNFSSVVNTHLKLTRLSPIARLAWELLRSVKSSAILLAAFEVILGENLTGSSLHRLAKQLADGAKRRTWGADAVPTSCLVSIEILHRLLQFSSSAPLTVAEVSD